MDNLEQQCEDALFELCDARERYPLQCANELEKCIKLETDLRMMEVRKSNIIDKPSSWEHNRNLNTDITENKISFKYLDRKLHSIINKLDNLEAVMDQIERDKKSLVNKLLRG